MNLRNKKSHTVLVLIRYVIEIQFICYWIKEVYETLNDSNVI